jgi:hypothetical protein
VKLKKGELEAIHQLSKNMYTCIGDAYSKSTKKGAVEDVARQLQSCQIISTGEILYLVGFQCCLKKISTVVKCFT